MPVVIVDLTAVKGAEDFHDVFAAALGFPSFYGRNLDAWIDCVSCADDPGAGMTSITVAPGEVLVLRLEGVARFAQTCPDLATALHECAAFVNWRRLERGETAIVALAFNK